MACTTENSVHFISPVFLCGNHIYDNDDATGLEKSFYPSGKLQETINYINDDRSGSYCLYYDNGRKQLEGNYHSRQP